MKDECIVRKQIIAVIKREEGYTRAVNAMSQLFQATSTTLSDGRILIILLAKVGI